MDAVRVTVVSDSHLSPRTPEAAANWDAFVEYLATTSSDLVVHLGDLALDGPGVPTGRRALDRLPGPRPRQGTAPRGEASSRGPRSSPLEPARGVTWQDVPTRADTERKWHGVARVWHGGLPNATLRRKHPR